MGLEMKYFVLKPRAKSRTDIHAMASQQAMRRYAEIVRDHDDELSDQLTMWSLDEQRKQVGLPKDTDDE
jgi:hypothetical protein